MSKVIRRHSFGLPKDFPSTDRIFDGDSSQKFSDDLAAKEVLGDDAACEEKAIHAAEAEGFATYDDQQWFFKR
ncbi:hypothetical protein ACIPEN_09640 [Herbaspirillum chlorophenolicum]|uniref:Uncharacterized protein n=1 Tax=Herbaspirillum chlorophenolicum TaxID=211589 RepID=A0ABW8EYZ2_9BURK